MSVEGLSVIRFTLCVYCVYIAGFGTKKVPSINDKFNARACKKIMQYCETG